MIENPDKQAPSERIRQRRSKALTNLVREEGQILSQLKNPRPSFNAKKTALAYLNARAQMLLADMDIHEVPLEELGSYTPLFAARGVGFPLRRNVMEWVGATGNVINFTEDIDGVRNNAWVALRMNGRRGKERVFVVEAEEPDLNEWIRIRRLARYNKNGRHSALPFLLFEDAVLGNDNTDAFRMLSKTLLRQSEG